MPTTIQLDEATRARLKALKEDLTYDELIRLLLDLVGPDEIVAARRLRADTHRQAERETGDRIRSVRSPTGASTSLPPERRDDIDTLIARARDDEDVLAVLLFGSAARGEAGPLSDVDVCLVLAEDAHANGADKRVAYMAEADLDVQVFSDLPLMVRQRVLAEGRVLFVRDRDALYDIARRTLREVERFRPIHDAYLEGVRARS